MAEGPLALVNLVVILVGPEILVHLEIPVGSEPLVNQVIQVYLESRVDLETVVQDNLDLHVFIFPRLSFSESNLIISTFWSPHYSIYYFCLTFLYGYQGQTAP